VLRKFERTAGDEAQGIVADPAALRDIVLDLVRDASWHIGVGIGPVDEPLPRSTRAGSGPAFLHARQAVNKAKSAPHRVSVIGSVGDDDYRAAHVETVLWLLAAIMARRSERGWEVADMLTQGRSRSEVAAALGISASAVSQRAQVAGVVEEQRGRELLVALLAEADR
ncbi:MAG: transposase, partial [Nocardioidaceae bacterium]